MKESRSGKMPEMSRRDFLEVVGATSMGVSLSPRGMLGAGFLSGESGPKKPMATVRGAFVYPPTASLRRVGYYSWPGSSFDAEGRQKEYMGRIRQFERSLGMRIAMDEKPLDDSASVTHFINDVKKSQPDGLLLALFKKGHLKHIMRILEEVPVPTVIYAPLGTLLNNHIQKLSPKPGVYLIHSLDNLDAIKDGMKMVKTAHWMKNSRIVSITGSEVTEAKVAHLGTEVRTIPHKRFYDEFARIESTDAAVRKLADAYLKNARKVIQPTRTDIVEAAKTYFVLKKIIRDEQADAVMMDCLPGLKRPHEHVPPCMGFMTLRDEGIAAGCQCDLNATLTLMLVQQLFDRPGFQQNASVETEKNHYFGAHCTSAGRMNGSNAAAEPYVLMSHAEAGWGCVPRVLFTPGQEVTMALYLSEETPRMLIYSGKVIGCPGIPRTGGCRSNIEMTINEVDDVRDVKGMHQIIFYGNYARRLRIFCELNAIKALT